MLWKQLTHYVDQILGLKMQKLIKMILKSIEMSKKVKLVLIVYSLFIVFNFLGFLIIRIGNYGFQDYSAFAIFFGPIPFCLLLFLLEVLVKRETFALLLPIYILAIKFIYLIFYGYTLEFGDLLIVFAGTFSSLFNIGQYFMQKTGIITILTEIALNIVMVCFYQLLILYLAKNTITKTLHIVKFK